jgi:hypothetical protein
MVLDRKIAFVDLSEGSVRIEPFPVELRRQYIGDMPDDMAAARRSEAGYKGIGLIMSAPDKASLKKELERAGADYIIEDFKQLKSLLEAISKIHLTPGSKVLNP